MHHEREVVFGPHPWPDRYTFVPAVRVGDTVYISGTTGTDQTGRITAPTDIVEQTRQIYRKFDALLRSLGGSCQDIVVTTEFFTTTDGLEKTAAVRREFFNNVYPTSTGVLAAGLLRKGALIEISAIAVLGSAKQEASR